MTNAHILRSVKSFDDLEDIEAYCENYDDRGFLRLTDNDGSTKYVHVYFDNENQVVRNIECLVIEKD